MIQPDARKRFAAFTLAEMLVGMGVFGLFSAGLVMAWTSLQTSALNMTAYAQRQSDQMRVLDYIKRDIRRATTVRIYSGGVMVAGTTPGTELRVTIPQYYTDAREEDNPLGPNVANSPSLAGTSVSYGGTKTVRYYTLDGAVVHNEAGTPRTIADASGAYQFSFRRELNGDVRCQLIFNQPMRGSGRRILRREVAIPCRQRSDLQL